MHKWEEPSSRLRYGPPRADQALGPPRDGTSHNPTSPPETSLVQAEVRAIAGAVGVPACPEHVTLAATSAGRSWAGGPRDSLHWIYLCPEGA